MVLGQFECQLRSFARYWVGTGFLSSEQSPAMGSVVAVPEPGPSPYFVLRSCSHQAFRRSEYKNEIKQYWGGRGGPAAYQTMYSSLSR